MKASAFSRDAADTIAAAEKPGPDGPLSLFSSDMTGLRKFDFFARRQIERCSDGKLPLRFVLLARPQERFAPFKMKAAPVRRVLVCFFKLGEREVGTVLRDQRLAPHLQRIGEVRAFLMCGL